MRFNEFQKELLAAGRLFEAVPNACHEDVKAVMSVSIGAQLEHITALAEMCGLNLDEIAAFWIQHVKDSQ